MDTFDLNRVIIAGRYDLPPFKTSSQMMLGDALMDATVHENDRLLLVVHEQEIFALTARHMSYFHVAQGEIGGKPWMVVF